MLFPEGAIECLLPAVSFEACQLELGAHIKVLAEKNPTGSRIGRVSDSRGEGKEVLLLPAVVPDVTVVVKPGEGPGVRGRAAG